jgi:hypothetical protein
MWSKFFRLLISKQYCFRMEVTRCLQLPLQKKKTKNKKIAFFFLVLKFNTWNLWEWTSCCGWEASSTAPHLINLLKTIIKKSTSSFHNNKVSSRNGQNCLILYFLEVSIRVLRWIMKALRKTINEMTLWNILF